MTTFERRAVRLALAALALGGAALCYSRPAAAQRLAPPVRCDCAASARDRGPWWLLALGIGIGGVIGPLARPEFTDLEGRPVRPIAVRDLPSAPIVRPLPAPRVPLFPMPPMQPVRSAPARVCVVEPIRPRGVRPGEKAWWRSLTPAERLDVIQRNRERDRIEAAQRATVCRWTVDVLRKATYYLALGAQ